MRRGSVITDSPCTASSYLSMAEADSQGPRSFSAKGAIRAGIDWKYDRMVPDSRWNMSKRARWHAQSNMKERHVLPWHALESFPI